jgi:YidC/Oxa1 family membrane protein insertase
MTDQRNLIIAAILTVLILVGYDYFFAKPQMQAQRAQQQTTQQAAPAQPVLPQAAGAPTSGEDVARNLPRLKVQSPRLVGSMTLAGGRIDDLLLTGYHETVDKKSPDVRLLDPVGGMAPYFAEFGWLAPNGDVTLPGPDTVWQASSDHLSPGNPVTLTWENGQGITFRRTFSLDENYMFTVTQSVKNDSGADVALAPFGRIARIGTPPVSGYYLLHEGPVGVVDGVLKEIKYKDIKKEGTETFTSQGGWLGITDKYWLTAIIPAQMENFTGGVRHTMAGDKDRYQVDVLYGTRTVASGSETTVTSLFFAGAKEVDLIENYAKTLKIDKFNLAIDWGFFRFLTQPIFHALDFLKGILGNFGLAIIALLVAMKLLFFPLANKSYVAMSKMKKLQPKIKALQEQYKDNKEQIQQETMKLYRDEKVNPVSGCLPMIIQIPVFWCLYKVLFVTIEMRHAPFYGWIHDLSSPDPAIILTGFGAFPWNVPPFLAIGIWPVLMGISMYLQQRLNPQAADPVQAKLVAFMPVIFTFMLARFPVGLVIYWTCNNLLSMTQQWIIMKRVERQGG